MLWLLFRWILALFDKKADSTAFYPSISLYRSQRHDPCRDALFVVCCTGCCCSVCFYSRSQHKPDHHASLTSAERHKKLVVDVLFESTLRPCWSFFILAAANIEKRLVSSRCVCVVWLWLTSSVRSLPYGYISHTQRLFLSLTKYHIILPNKKKHYL